MTEHKEKRIKVNAWVDEGVVPLVEALNLFPDVFTVDSCESKKGEAYVMFLWRGPQNRLLHFMAELSVAGGTDRSPADFYVEYRLHSGNTAGMATVHCIDDPGLIQSVSKSICLLAKEYGYKH